MSSSDSFVASVIVISDDLSASGTLPEVEWEFFEYVKHAARLVCLLKMEVVAIGRRYRKQANPKARRILSHRDPCHGGQVVRQHVSLPSAGICLCGGVLQGHV